MGNNVPLPRGACGPDDWEDPNDFNEGKMLSNSGGQRVAVSLEDPEQALSHTNEVQ